MKVSKKICSVLMVLALLVGMLIVPYNAEAKTTRRPKLNKAKITLTVGKTYKLKVKNGKAKSFVSTKKKIASVSKKGVIKAKKKGTCKIKVKVKGSKKTLICKVTVKAKKRTEKTTENVTEKTTENATEDATENVACEHEFEKGKTSVVHHDAVYEKKPVEKVIHHEAITEKRVYKGTECNLCQEKLYQTDTQSLADVFLEHANSKHPNKEVTSLAIPAKVVVVVLQEAYDEVVTEYVTVLVKEAYDEVTQEYICKHCGYSKSEIITK